MTTLAITFKINDFRSIKIINLCSECDNIYKYDAIKIVFQDKETEYVISENDYFLPKLENFYLYIKEALKNNLSLEQTIQEDLGYLWNQTLHATATKPLIQLNAVDSKEVERYLVWSFNDFDTWLYNKNESIILEITPSYKWHFIDPVDGEEFIPYDEWIKNYKPLFITEIDKKIAEHWLDQAGKIIQKVEKSDSQYLHTQE